MKSRYLSFLFATTAFGRAARTRRLEHARVTIIVE